VKSKIYNQKQPLQAFKTEMDPSLIREQLNRMLSDRLFQHSKRCGSMLRYIVEQALEGKNDHVKERTIGVEVFGRDPDYDCSSDPIVRVNATDLRKRIALYYAEPARATEVHIDLPSGSYMPEFRHPETKPVPSRSIRIPRYWPLYSVLLLVFVMLAVISALWLKPRKAETALDLFWRPLLLTQGDVLICVAPPVMVAPDQAAPEQSATVSSMNRIPANNVSLDDMIAVSKICGYLSRSSKRFDIRNHDSVTITDLRGRPAVLIGGFNNQWALRLLRELRFSFDSADNSPLRWIKDNQNPERKWSVDSSRPYRELEEDYAVISRVLDPTTEQMLVSVAGITRLGTIAAGDYLTSENNLETLFKQTPQGWKGNNLQFVLATKIIQGSAGPSRIIASIFW
jgi:hypothetical protein